MAVLGECGFLINKDGLDFCQCLEMLFERRQTEPLKTAYVKHANAETGALTQTERKHYHCEEQNARQRQEIKFNRIDVWGTGERRLRKQTTMCV